MRSLWYDRQGNPLHAVDALLRSDTYRIVEQTRVGRGFVSTVWLGLDHGYEGEEPIIFETCVFGGGEPRIVERYVTEGEAIEGHRQWVRRME